MDNRERTSVIVSGSIKPLDVKSKTLLGKPYTVLPATMMIEGTYTPYVDNAKDVEELFFSATDLKQSVNSWNGRPVSLNHPDGQTTCNSPEGYDKQWIGYVFNARYDTESKSLKSELWIDKERGSFLNKRVSAGDCIDVSIGAFGDLIPPINSTGNYDFRMTNIIGDHLAVLPDSKGACSWADGCGIRAKEYKKVEENNLDEDETTVNQATTQASVKALTFSSNNLKLKVSSKGGKMAECEETRVEHVHKVEVEAKAAEPKEVFTVDQMLEKLEPGSKKFLVTAMKSYNDNKKKFIGKIVGCKSAAFCEKALNEINDLELLESISEVAILADASPAEVTVQATDYQMRGAGTIPQVPEEKWSVPKDIDWNNFNN